MPVEDSSIISLGEKDAAELAALEGEIFSQPWSEEQYKGLLAASSAAARRGAKTAASFQVLGLRGPDACLDAYVSFGLHLAAGELEIYNIATRPQLRRRGKARILLQEAMRLAANRACARAVLEVREKNEAALALYFSLGFHACGRRKNYYSDTGEDALVLECDLRRAPDGQAGQQTDQ